MVYELNCNLHKLLCQCACTLLLIWDTIGPGIIALKLPYHTVSEKAWKISYSSKSEYAMSNIGYKMMYTTSLLDLHATMDEI